MIDFINIWSNKLIANRFELIKPISVGGMGAIFLVFDNNLRKSAILKTPLIKDPALKSKINARFFREVYALSALEHPFIVPIIYTGKHEDYPFIVSRFINGGTLRDLINLSILNHKPLTIDPLYDWVPKIGEALNFMHSKNWVHRDVKPDNILFDSTQNCYLTDFGISKHLSYDPANCITTANSIVGSPMYMSPEQHLGHRATAKGDQYSLAVAIYEALTNKLPFDGKTQSAILLEIIRQNAIPLQSRFTNSFISDKFNNAIMKALNFDPDKRYDTIEHFLLDLFKESDSKFEFSGFHKKNISGILPPPQVLSDSTASLKTSQTHAESMTSATLFSGLQNEMQKINHRILNEQVYLKPEQLTKLLNLLVASEIFDTSKRKEIIDTLNFIFIFDSNKTNAGVL